MTKRLGGKLLSVILTIAICLSTVLGCLITANAADVACYSWSEGTVDKDSLKTATIDLTLTAPADLSGGIVEAVFNFNSAEWAISKIDITNGACVSGEFDAANYSVSFDGNQVDFATTPVDPNVDSDTLSVSNVTLGLTLTFKSGTAEQGEKYNVTISELNMGNSYEAYNYTATAVNGVVNAGCDHVYSVAGLEPIETNTVDGYYVYKDVPCSKCGDINPYQIVPATELKNILYWDGTATEPTTTDSEGNILITSAAELAYITQNGAVGNYKVADGIDAIVLQPKAYAESIMALADYAQTKAYFESISSPTVWKNGGAFKGTFDGNGVEIYGIYTQKSGQGALFAFANEGTTFKNFSIKNSYIGSGDFAGTVVGKIYATKELTEVSAENVITFDKLVISGNYLEFDHKNYSRMGILFGGEQPWTSGTQYNTKYITFTITNSLVHSNLGVATMYPGVYAGLFGARHTGWNPKGTAAPNKYDNLIILDCTPYGYTNDDPATTPAGTKATNQATQADFYSNVYTNCVTEFSPCTNNPNWSSYDGKIIVIDKAEAKGTGAKTNLSGLAWDSVWFADENGGYPVFDGKTVSMPDYSIYDHATKTGSVIYHCGDNAAYDDEFEGSGTQDDPYIITNIQELRTVLSRRTEIKYEYFKLADGIKYICATSEANLKNRYKTITGNTGDSATALQYILNLDDAEKAREFLIPTMNWWNMDIASGYVGFNGEIDFNGATVVGMRSSSGGFINSVQGKTTIKNLTIKNSYITGWASGALISINTPSTKETVGDLTIENCAVTDCYIDATTDYQNNVGSVTTGRAGALIGYATNYYSIPESELGVDKNGDGDMSDTAYINGKINVDNCFVNLDENCVISSCEADATNTFSHGGLFGQSGNGDTKVSNCVVLGIKPYSTWNTSVANGVSWQSANPSIFSNVYTDQSLDYGYNGSNVKVTYNETQIKKISVSDIKGVEAKDALNGFDFDNVWSYDGNGGYPTPVKQPAIYTTSQLNLNLLGVNNNYNNDGTFNFNFYYEPASASIAPVLYVGRADGNGFNKLTGTALEAAEASALGVAEGTLRYTIENISAREIGDTFLGTAVAKNGASTVWGKTEAISVADYAGALLKDNSVSAADKKVAAALINYGSTSAEALGITTPVGIATDTVYFDGAWNAESFATLADSDDGSGDGSSWEEAIIIDNAEELFYLTRRSTKAETTNLYFKVADNIKNFVLQRSSSVDADKLMAMTDAEEIKDYLSGLNNLRKWDNNGSFNGNFDGNGATVYGLYAESAPGLFGYVDCGVKNENNFYYYRNTSGEITGTYYYDNVGTTIKNINVANSYFYSGWLMGGIVCSTYGTKDDQLAGILNLESCSVVNCYFTGPETGNNLNAGSKGIFTGLLYGGDVYKLNNCITYGTVVNVPCTTSAGASNGTATMLSVSGGVNDRFTVEDAVHELTYGSNGYTTSARIYNRVTNSIILGTYPYWTSWSNAASHKNCFANVYTDQSVNVYDTNAGTTNFYKDVMWQNTDLTAYQGATVKTTCSKLDWANDWVVNTKDYPEIAQRGAKLETGKTIYWNSSTDSTLADNGETGADWDNAIIIDSAEELNYLVNNQQNYFAGSSFATKDKYYKMADGIDYAILQPEGTLNVEKLLSLDGAGVKLYFEDEIGLSNLVNWETNSGEMWFGGHFDGNGVTFAGMYSADSSAGLFATADGGAEFKNLAVVSSYIDGVAGNARTGAIVGGTCGSGFGAGVAGIVSFDTIMVANNYLHCYTNQSNGAIVMGACNDQDAVSINNAIVYGNASKYDNQGNTGLEDKTMHLYNGVKNSINASLKSTVTNSIILGTRPYYTGYDANMSGVESLENVYTDQPLNPYSQVTYATTDLAAITYDELIGSKAQSVVDALNNANDEVWYIGNSFDGMPGFKKANNMPGAYQIAYNSAVVLDTYNDYGESTEDFGLYTTSLNFKNNPYLSLTFAFGNLDGVNTKLDRQNITVTVNGTELPKLPAYEDDVYLSNANGWTNKKGAGRYHMYKLDDLNVYDLSKPITVTIKYGDKTITSTVSVEGFALELQKAYMVAPCDYYATRLEAVKALLFYTQALNDRYGA